MTVFVEIYHPDLPQTITTPARVAEQALDEYYDDGWLLVDPEVTPPAPSTPYYTTAAADSRFVRQTLLDGLVADEIDDDASETATRLRAALVAYDVTGPIGGVTDATASFVAAATAAQADGRTFVRARPGLYHCPGMTSDDMGDLFIVGDGVTFTPTTYVAAWSTQDWANRNRAVATPTGRGAIAITVDDAVDSHWETLFPFTKDLGIVIAEAWPTGNGAQWVKEVWRHGWEIASHGVSHANFHVMTEAQVHTEAQGSRDAIAAITGQSDNIGFVYPQHARTEETDRILSQYFVSGRGEAGDVYYPADSGHRWLLTARDATPDMVTGAVSASLKRTLRALAASDSRMLIYFHWDAAVHTTAVRELVAYARAQGIAIMLPGQMLSTRRVTTDPYIEATDQWTSSSGWERSADKAYKGTASMKFAPTGGGFGSGTIEGKPVPAGSRAGLFSVFRGSFRYQASTVLNLSAAGQGLYMSLAERGRTMTVESDGTVFGGGYTSAFPRLPGTATIPAAEWTRLTQTLIVGPDVTSFTPRLGIQNLARDQAPLYVDEIKLELMDRVSALRFSATLNGTTVVTVWTGVINLPRYGISIAPKASIAGQVYVTTDVNGRVEVRSTNAADTAAVDIVITPSTTYATDGYTWPTTGA